MKSSPVASALLAGALLAGLGGCAHFPQKLASLFGRTQPVSANVGQVGPYSAEDRLYADAVAAIDKRHYGEALDLLQVARDSRPSDPRVLTAMGVVYDKLGRFDLSDRYYDQAEQADPGSRIVAMDRRYSMMLRNAGQSAEHMDSGPALAQAQLVAPTPVSNSQTRPAARIRLVADASGVVRMNPRPATPRPAVQRAARAPTPAPVLSPTDRLYADGVAAIHKREYGEAIGFLRQARDLSPEDARVLTALGVTYDHLGRFDLSSRYYDEAGKLAPGSEVLAQDRRTSQMLQQHGGFAGPEDVVVLAGAAPKAPTLSLAKAPARTRHGA
jgi:Flp pilus assembly protein TadD